MILFDSWWIPYCGEASLRREAFTSVGQVRITEVKMWDERRFLLRRSSGLSTPRQRRTGRCGRKPPLLLQVRANDFGVGQATLVRHRASSLIIGDLQNEDGLLR
jgi:hypothetical protein